MSFAEAELTRDAFLDGRLQLWQPRRGYRAATDPVLLAAFVPARLGQLVLDLGCGAGTAALCLGRRVAGLQLHGLELLPEYAGLARRNAAANDIAMTVHEGDLRRPPAALRRLAFDHVLINPPFLVGADAMPADDPGRDAAFREGGARLGDWIRAALRRLAPGGRLVLIQRTERLADLLAALKDHAGEVEILPVAARSGRSAGRVLVRARKASAAPLRLLAPLTMHEGGAHARDGNDYTEEARKILRHMSELLPDSRIGGNSV
jgi:tRNA1(Val) A37 N6-methylase TrmN6